MNTTTTDQKVVDFAVQMVRTGTSNEAQERTKKAMRTTLTDTEQRQLKHLCRAFMMILERWHQERPGDMAVEELNAQLKRLVTPELSGVDRDALERQWPLLIDQLHQTWAGALGGDLTMRYGG
jgi:hypothetical protein